MAGYIGSATAVVSNGGEKKVTVTASGGQTAISNVSYAPGQVDVYHNGVRLVDGTDYTATNGTSITLTVAAAANDQIVVRSFNTFQVSDNVSASGGGSFAADVTFATGADIITSSLGTSNFRAGVNAGNSITSGGNQNVVVGDEAGTAITTGDQNSILGYSAGVALTTGNRNTLLGSTAGDALVGAERNTAVGYGALHTETEGDRNTAVGVFALSTQNTTGGGNIYNTAVGYAAGNLVTTGVQNTLIGALAGDALTEANFNVAIGSQALSTDTEGSRSIAIGQHALQVQNFTSATNGYNVAVGYDAGVAVTTGINNTLIGGLAGDSLTDADYNTVVGYNALSTNVLGSRSVAIGFEALKTQNPVDGSNNPTAVDMYNVGIGFNAGTGITTGINNVTLGGLAGTGITTGGGNICIGKQAGVTSTVLTTGGSNIIIGLGANTGSASRNNSIVMGEAVVSVSNGQFTFGTGTSDSNIANGATSISAPSDQRYKEEIADATAGLAFIKDLRPVTFKWKKEKDLPTSHRAYVEDSETRTMNNSTNHGFIAQEVKTAIDAHSEIKDGFDMWCTDDQADGGRQRIADGALIPMLVKAIQELEARVATLEG